MKTFLRMCVLAFLLTGCSLPMEAGGEATEEVVTGLPAPLACDASQGSCYAPPPSATFQWQLSCDRDPSCTNLDVRVDWYDIDWQETPAATVESIHAMGAHAACYISAGSWEEWRPDAGAFPAQVIGEDYEDWAGEKWLDVRRLDVLLPIMTARMQVCRQKGFDGAQFDNLDSWQQETGFDLARADVLRYAAELANAAHSLGLSAAWENGAENVPDLLPYMDWFMMESCNAWNECELALPFIQAGRFVGDVEYDEQFSNLEFCGGMQALGIRAAFKNLNLDSFMLPCW